MTKLKTCCVDASVVVRLLISPDDHVVREIWDGWQQEGVEIIAPGLLLYEVTNALYQQQRQNRLSADMVSLMIRTARALPIKLYAGEDLHDHALRIATKFELSAAYDAHYLASAEQNAASFWTSDRRLVDKIGGRLDWIYFLPRE